jgi:ribosomal protein L11 methyltransferase
MYIWRKLAEPGWLNAQESVLQARSRGKLVIVSRPGRKRLQLEVACPSLDDSRKLIEEFGGRSEEWPRDWLKRFADPSKPLKIGKRLLIARSMSGHLRRCSIRCPQRIPLRRDKPGALGTMHATRRSKKTQFLVIPASAAFGTGEHATTAMSLRFLERLTRKWKYGWSLGDLGTGSGILALAAKRFGAKRVIGIDIDPKAVSIAKANARLNKIVRVNFRVGDLRKWKTSGTSDIVVANLYTELLIETLPQLKRCNWLILSGVLRTQENKLLRVLRRNNIEIANVKRRGKWIAVLANCSGAL